jgi:hypothetical protein
MRSHTRNGMARYYLTIKWSREVSIYGPLFLEHFSTRSGNATITIKRNLLHETAAPTKKEMIYVLTKNLNLLRPP